MTVRFDAVTVTEISIEVDYKLALNAIATVIFAALYWLHRLSIAESGSGGHRAHAQTTD